MDRLTLPLTLALILTWTLTPNTTLKGDFVDRGQHGVEVLLTLFAMKAVPYPYPDIYPGPDPGPTSTSP